MSGAHERIGPTAHYTAYVWRAAGFERAELFSTWQGAALYWGFFVAGEWATRLSSSTPSMRVYLEYRHRLIDALVRRHRPDVVVELGAGLTRRAVSWALGGSVRGLEYDLPDMVARKRAALARAPDEVRRALAGRHRVEAANLVEPAFAHTLRDALCGAERPVVVAEGLLSYLAAPERAQLYASVAGALGPQGLFVCDLHTRAGQASVGAAASILRTAIRTLTRRRAALDSYADEADVCRVMGEAGLAEVSFADPAAHYAAEPKLGKLHSPTHVVTALAAPG
ncbi:MAG: class I SAM-dependent methyltransferase [Nannocystaceae bacterium]|nr:class I SAM-dependent methyltransferase [Nannocystaceae bacterium]